MPTDYFNSISYLVLCMMISFFNRLHLQYLDQLNYHVVFCKPHKKDHVWNNKQSHHYIQLHL